MTLRRKKRRGVGEQGSWLAGWAGGTDGGGGICSPSFGLWVWGPPPRSIVGVAVDWLTLGA